MEDFNLRKFDDGSFSGGFSMEDLTGDLNYHSTNINCLGDGIEDTNMNCTGKCLACSEGGPRPGEN